MNCAFRKTYHNEWCIQNWGTKWNAYGYEPDTDYGSADALTFQTAWAGPQPILQRLSEMFTVGLMRISGQTAGSAAISAVK